MSWPAYMSRETLAAALEIKAGAVDQYVRRGLLPAPVQIGEAVRWRWDDVDQWIKARTQAGSTGYVDGDDPYMGGSHAQGSAARTRSPRQGAGEVVLLSASAQGHEPGAAKDTAS